jgi:adenylate cyclase
MGKPAFLATFDNFFACAAGPVLRYGGEALRFIGDAVLAIFPLAGPGAAQRALAAAGKTESRMVALNAAR